MHGTSLRRTMLPGQALAVSPRRTRRPGKTCGKHTVQRSRLGLTPKSKQHTRARTHTDTRATPQSSAVNIVEIAAPRCRPGRSVRASSRIHEIELDLGAADWNSIVGSSGYVELECLDGPFCDNPCTFERALCLSAARSRVSLSLFRSAIFSTRRRPRASATLLSFHRMFSPRCPNSAPILSSSRTHARCT